MKALVITIEEKAIAQGMYDMFPEQELNILSFGMLPAPFMEMVNEGLKEKFTSMMEAKMEISLAEIQEHEKEIAEMFPDLKDSLLYADFIKQRKQFVREVSHAVAVEIYAIHARAGKMVV